MSDNPPRVTYRNALQAGVEGKAWNDTARFAQRLPDRAQPDLREELWPKCLTSAGFALRFRADARRIWARWILADRPSAPPSETSHRGSGLDLYARDPRNRWRWVGQGLPRDPQPVDDGHLCVTALLTWSPMDRGPLEYLLYLPLGGGLQSLELGLEDETPPPSLQLLGPRDQKPVVFYGTSIVHGGSASRPGLVHTAILGRRLDVPVVNLGFPGQGQLDLELAELMTEIDAAAYVVDALPNCGADKVIARTAPFVRILRKARPNVPIVLVEEDDHPVSPFSTTRREEKLAKRRAFRREILTLIDEGMTDLLHVPGDALFGADGEGTGDGIHPNDLGFMRQANRMEPVLGEALARGHAR